MGKKISEVGSGVDTALTGATLFEIEKAGASGHTSLDEMKKFISPIVANENWADLPAAEDLDLGAIVFCKDYPPYIGSYWKALPAFNLYIPIAGEVLLGIAPSVTTEDGTSEQIIAQYFVGAAMTFTAAELFLHHALTKSSGAIAATLKIRLGPAGDLTDPVVQTAALLSASRSPVVSVNIKFTSSSSCWSAQALDNGGVDASVVVSDVSIADVTAAGYKVTISVEHASAGVTATLKNGYMKLILV